MSPSNTEEGFEIEKAENLAEYLENLDATGEALYEIDPEICADTIRAAVAEIKRLRTWIQEHMEADRMANE